MASVVNFFVYYIELPMELEAFVRNDNQMSLMKDGVKSMKGGRFPRLTIRIKPVSPSKDKDRVRNLLNILQGLQNTGEIIGFSQG